MTTAFGHGLAGMIPIAMIMVITMAVRAWRTLIGRQMLPDGTVIHS